MSEEQDFKKLRFNRPQLRFMVHNPASATSVWSRATGKSSNIAWLMHTIVQGMPRSAWGLVGSTYLQILTRTLPSTIGALERIGYIKDVHYFIGRKPPESWRWPTPYEPPVKYDHFIIFYTGAGFHLISLDGGSGSSRGLNIDGVIADESLLINKERFDAEVLATNRGNLRYFDHLKIHHGVFHFSSMPHGDQGKWLLKDGDHYLKGGYDFQALQDELIGLQLQFIDKRDRTTRLRLWGEIQELTKRLRFFPDADGRLYSEANVFENLENVGIKYLQDQRRDVADFIFLIEVLNKRPGQVEAGFYPMLKTSHHAPILAGNDKFLQGLEFNLKKLSEVDSRMDGDCQSHLPLRVAVDWGGKISVLTVAQQDGDEYRFLRGMYVKHPKLINDLADEFLKYYRYHLKKELVFIEDTEWGNSSKPDSNLTFNEQFLKRIIDAGWRVVRTNLGRVPSYQTRYQLAHEYLSEKDSRLLRIRFNRYGCKDLLTAMALAPLRQNRKGQIEKDKRSEGGKGPQEEATHFTDTFDLHLLSIDKHVANLQPDFSDFIIISA